MDAQTVQPQPTSLQTTIPRPRERRELGISGLQVSPYCIGIIEEPEAIPAAFEAGINFFFVTADMHWPLYEQTRQGLKMLLERRPEVRDQIVVAGVAYVTQPEFCVAPFEEILEEVPELEYLDAVIAGGAYKDNLSARMETLNGLRDEGEMGIRSVGASFHDRTAAVDWLNRDAIDIAFIRYNPIHQGAHQDLFPHLDASRKSLMYGFKSMTGYIPAKDFGLPEEYWMPEPSDHYRFALSTAPLHGILCSPTTPEEVADLVAATELGPLDPSKQEHMLTLAEMLKEAAGLA